MIWEGLTCGTTGFKSKGLWAGEQIDTGSPAKGWKDCVDGFPTVKLGWNECLVNRSQRSGLEHRVRIEERTILITDQRQDTVKRVWVRKVLQWDIRGFL